MKDVCEMQEMPSELEYQCVYEDSKARVYLSLVPSEEIRRQRRKEAVWAFEKALRIVLGPVSAISVQILLSTGMTLLTYEVLAAKLQEIRGYTALGSEGFFAACVGIMTFKTVNWIFRNKRWI